MHKLLPIFFISGLLIWPASAQDSTPGDDKQDKSEQTQTRQNQQFVDENGDGFNDDAPDHDGDGIPNGLDPDWKKLKAEEFIDLDGDGINDNISNTEGSQNQNRYGPLNEGQQSRGTPEMKTEDQKQQHQERKGKQRNN